MSKNKNENINFKINSESLAEMSLIERCNYFKNCAKEILRMPVKNPKKVYLDGKEFIVDERFEEDLELCYRRYREIYYQVKLNMDNKPTCEIDWKYIKGLSIQERVRYFERMICKMSKTTIVDLIEVKGKYYSYRIDKKDQEVFKTCLEEYTKAILGIDTFKREYNRNPITRIINKISNNFKIKKAEKELRQKIANLTGIKDKKANIKKSFMRTLQSSNTKNGIILGLVCLGIITGASVAYSILGNEDKKQKKDDDRLREEESTGKVQSRSLTEEPIHFESIVEPLYKDEIAEYFDEIRNIKLEEERKALRERRIEQKRELIDSYLEEYSSYFNLDSSKVIEIARAKTNNYDEGFETVLGDSLYNVDPENMEAACIIFVRQISRNRLTFDLKEFGLTSNDLKVSDEILSIPKGEELIMRTGETYPQFMGRICDAFGMDKCFTLAISYFETGRGTSGLCRLNNNYGGMRYDGIWLEFPSPEAGIIAHCYNLLSYSKYNIKSWERMAQIYAEGSEHWISQVKIFYNQISENQEEYFNIPELADSSSDSSVGDYTDTVELDTDNSQIQTGEFDNGTAYTMSPKTLS